jgi:exosortase
MHNHYQRATQRLHEFAGEAADWAEADLREDLAAQGVDVPAFLRRLEETAAVESKVVTTAKKTAAAQVRAFVTASWVRLKSWGTGAAPLQTSWTEDAQQPQINVGFWQVCSRPCARRLMVFVGLLVLCFGLPFRDWLRLSQHEALWRHLPLIPCLTAWLIWRQRADLTTAPAGARWPGAALTALALGLLASTWSQALGPGQPLFDRLPALMMCFCLLVWAGAFFILGGTIVRRLAFPAAFLLFMVPWPTAMVAAATTAFQHPSAEVTYGLLRACGVPVLRDGLEFRMPGLSIVLASECYGPRSDLVLLVASLLFGYCFLRTGWKRAVLALLVIPLAILRNAVRLLVLSLLCVNVDPAYIDSPLHHQGGPIFFGLSLIPFALIFLWLVKSDRRSASTPAPVSPRR